MPTLREIFMFPPMRGGLNLKDSPLGLGPEWLIEAQNVEYTTAGARKKRKGQQKINSAGLVEDSPISTVDEDSAAGQKVLYVGATTGFGAGDYVAIGRETAREEYNRISSVTAGDYLTLEDNLANLQPAGDLVESNETSNSSHGLRSSAARTFLKQGFSINGSESLAVNKISLKLFRNGSLSGEMWVEIWGNDGSDQPDDGNKLSDDNNVVKVTVDALDTSPAWVDFTLSTPAVLTQGSVYHLVVRGDYAISGSDYIAWRTNSTNAYRDAAAPHCAGYSSDGASWTEETAEDYTFRIYETTEVRKSAAVTGYLDFIKDNEQQIQIVAASNGKLFTEGGGTLTERVTGLTTGVDVLWTMTVFKNNAILANGSDRPLFTPDGVSFSEINDSSLPFAAWMPTVWRNRLWMADGGTLYYSSLDSLTDWTTSGGEIPIHGGKGPITALIPFYQYLVVAKADFIAVITGSTPSDFAIRPLVEGVGIAGPAAWARVGNDALFVSLEEVRSLATVEDAGELKHSALSNPIEPFLREEVNPNRRRYIQCAFYSAKQQLFIAHADRNSTIENKAAVLDVLSGGWATYTPLLAHVLATRRTSLGHRQLIAGGHDGFLRLLDSSDADDGSGISTTFKTPHLDLGRPNLAKGWRKLILFGKARGATLLIDYEIDFKQAGFITAQIQGFGDPLGSVAGSFTLGSSSLGGGETLHHEEFLLDGSGHFISFKITNTGANQPFTLLGLGVEAQLEGVDKWAP